MKKIIFFLLFSHSFLSAQNTKETEIANKHHEFRFDMLSVVLDQKYSFSYEYFTKGDISFGLNANFSNSKKTNEDFDNGYRNNVPRYEFNPYVRYALSKSKSRFYFIEVFGSYNGGDFKEIIRQTEQNVGFYVTKKSTYTDFALGGSLGYKMYFKESLALEFIVGFGKNLTNTDRSPDVISRVGLNLGYRF
jgi:hypothetical protein